MASGLRAGTAWYGMRPPPADDGDLDRKSTDKSDKGASGGRAQRRRRYQSASGTARIVGLI